MAYHEDTTDLEVDCDALAQMFGVGFFFPPKTGPEACRALTGTSKMLCATSILLLNQRHHGFLPYKYLYFNMKLNSVEIST